MLAIKLPSIITIIIMASVQITTMTMPPRQRTNILSQLTTIRTIVQPAAT
jgi:hypothetical protein